MFKKIFGIVFWALVIALFGGMLLMRAAAEMGFRWGPGT